MKKTFRLLSVLLLGATVWSCSYDDSALWDKVNDLDGRVQTLETTVKGMNTSITSLKGIVEALDGGKVITKTESTADGYILTLSDGSTLTLKNGKDGKDAPVIGVKADTDGVYYWTVTTDGKTEFLKDAEGGKLKVSGTTPVMGVDSEGYWTVDTGNGVQRILSDGKPVKAQGQDGDSFIKSVTIVGKKVVFTLMDGGVLEMELTNMRILTFEDEASSSYWTSLIDNPQYDGKLLYGESGAESTYYSWIDNNNTFLAHEFEVDKDSYMAYWVGGEAISNYVETDLKKGDFDIQLSVPVKDPVTEFGGNNGSKNFCVHYGYGSTEQYEASLKNIYFSDGNARVIDHMFVCPTTYVLNAEKNGNGITDKIGPNDWFKIIAIGVDADGNKTGTSEFYLAKDGKMVENWTRWDLHSLGKVMMVYFNMEGSVTNKNGLSLPAYFAYDDVAVRFDN